MERRKEGRMDGQKQGSREVSIEGGTKERGITLRRKGESGKKEGKKDGQNEGRSQRRKEEKKEHEAIMKSITLLTHKYQSPQEL